MNTTSLREILQDKARAEELTKFFVEKAIDAECVDLNDEAQGDYTGAYDALLNATSSRNVAAIFSENRSPIELAFLNSLHLCFIKAAPINAYFTLSAPDHLHYMDQFISFHRDLDSRYSEFMSLRPEASVSDFIQKAKEIYFQIEGVPMPDDTRVEIEAYLYFLRIFAHNYFHLTMEANLPTIRHNGSGMRPDLFIWCPTCPELKIAVECDGYQWHSDKDSFTNDRQRDRILYRNGIDVMRFSGSEIHKDPCAAASDLFEQLCIKAEMHSLGINKLSEPPPDST